MRRGAAGTRLAEKSAGCTVAVAAVFLLWIAGAAAEPLASIPNPRTRDATWVTDMPGALRADTVGRLNAMIDALEQKTTAEVAVVVIGSLDGLTIDEAAVRLFELWGIGKRGADNGLLFLWSTGDRRVRIEVGYGLEAVLPDGKVGAILDAYVIPRFRANEFDEGVLDGVEALVRTVSNEPVALPSARSESYDGGGSFWTPTTMGLFGSIPAGLASLIGFRRWRRYHRRRCPQCQTLMSRLSETDDDALLREQERVEERIGSVDYDVWKCPSCSHHFTLRYPKWLTEYDKCPQCHNRTRSSTQTTVVSPTTSSTGTARVHEACAFCTYESEYTKVLPRLEEHSSSSSSGGSSGSSFGGGSSGGGGASRGY